MPEQQKKYKTTVKTLIDNLLILLLSGLWIGYFVKFYLEIDSSLMSNFITKIFYCEIIASFVDIGFQFIGFYADYTSIGNIYTIRERKNIRILNNKPLKIIYSLNKNLIVALCIIIAYKFIPYTHTNCHSYSH
jgi:hypothetical protein